MILNLKLGAVARDYNLNIWKLKDENKNLEPDFDT